MADEIELKLAIAPERAAELRKLELLRRLSEKRGSTRQLSTVYFDTPDQALSRRGIALRIRSAGRRKLQTIKLPAEGPGGLQVLREIENAWLQSEGPFPCREVVAVLLHILAFDFHAADFLTYRGVPSDDLWRRSVEDWFSTVSSPEAECSRLCPNHDASEYTRVVESLCDKLWSAAKSWEQVAPDEPSCEQVIQALVGELVRGDFARMAIG